MTKIETYNGCCGGCGKPITIEIEMPIDSDKHDLKLTRFNLINAEIEKHGWIMMIGHNDHFETVSYLEDPNKIVLFCSAYCHGAALGARILDRNRFLQKNPYIPGNREMAQGISDLFEKYANNTERLGDKYISWIQSTPTLWCKKPENT